MLQRDIRNMNRRIVFDLFRKHREMTRGEVAQRSGISMPSVLKAVQPFVEANVLVPMGEASAPLGRKPLMLRFNSDAIAAYGVEYEGDRLSIGLVRIDGSIERQVVLQVRRSIDESFVKAVLSGIAELGGGRSSGQRIAGVGIGIPGAVDPNRRIIHFAPLIGVREPLDATPLLARIERSTGLPVLMENDVNVAAVGEYLVRSEAEPDLLADLLYVSLGAGLGGGLILDGTLRRGANFLCGEIGYYTSTADFHASTREQGWLESRLNVKALEERFGPIVPSLARDERVLAYLAEHLGPVLANLASVLDIDRVVLGGVVVDELGEPLVERIAQSVNQLALRRIDVSTAVSREPGIIGAATLVIESRLDALVAMES